MVWLGVAWAAAVAAPGDLETGIDLQLPFNSIVFNVLTTPVQTDGKIVIGGRFDSIGGTTRNHLARLNPDGTLDAGFNPDPGQVLTNDIQAMIVQSDGKIIVAGGFLTMGGVTRNRIARLEADGSVDPGFNPNANGDVQNLTIQADGKILVGGVFTTMGGVGRNRIARLNSDGTLDTGFNPDAGSSGVRAIALQADGRIVMGGSFTNVAGTVRSKIARLNADGTLDVTFNPNVDSTVNCIAIQGDGRIVVGGSFTKVDGVARNQVARLNPDGSLTAGFDLSQTNGAVYSAVVQADGKTIVGWWDPQKKLPGNYVVRLNVDGSLDTTFNVSFAGEAPRLAAVASLALQGDGRILAGGDFTGVNGALRNSAARLDNGMSFQRLTAPSLNRVEWLRDGTAPETQVVQFALSTDGAASWSNLGFATRIPGGWELTGLSLPASGLVRAQARVTGGRYNGSSWLVEAVAAIGEPKAGQSISFGFHDAKYLGMAPFALSASTSSGLPITFSSSNPGVAAVSGNTVTLVGAGTTTITASQGGDANYLAATPVSRTLVVNPTAVAPSITVQPVSLQTAPGSIITFNVTATGTPPLSYRWRFNGADLYYNGLISGVTTSTLSVIIQEPAAAGSFDVIVTNVAGNVTSTSTTLSVGPHPKSPSVLNLSGRTLLKLLADKVRPLVYGLVQESDDGNADNYLIACDATTGMLVAEMPLQWNATDMAMSSGGDALFIIHTGSRTIQKLDLATFAMTGTRVISTPNAYLTPNSGLPEQPLRLAAGRSNLVYFTDGGWTPGIYTFNFDASKVLGGFDDDNGVGGLAATKDGNTLFTWRQYGWSAGNVNSWVTRMNSQASTPVPLETSFVSWRRDPFDTPILLNAQETLVFNKQQAFAATNVSMLVQQFEENIYAINSSGEIAFGNSKVFSTATGYRLASLPTASTVQALSADEQTLFLYPSNPANQTRQLTNYAMSSLLGAGWETNPAPAITTQPVSQTVAVGDNVSLSVFATANTPLRYQWRANGTNLLNATNATLSFTSISSNAAAAYSVIVADNARSVLSSNAVLSIHIPLAITTQPASQTVTAGSNATFAVIASGPAPLAFQWSSNGVALASATNSTLVLSNVQPAFVAGYSVVVTNSVGSVTSSVATLTVNVPPAVTLQPVNQSVVVGSNVTFSVAAGGTAPLSYQWRFNGVIVPGATTPSFTWLDVQTNQSGNYDVVITNVAGSVVSSNAVLTVNPTPTAPSLTSQPTNQTVLAGTNTTLAVVAGGTSPLFYQWMSNGVALASATNATLTFTNIQTNATASYSVTVTNSLGSVTSSNALLTVNAPPGITTQPLSQVVFAGSNVSFTVAAGGTAPLAYQWRFNGTPLANGGRISGAATAVLTVGSVVLGDMGGYDVVVTNVAGSLVSSNAVLTVNSPPVAPGITVQPTNQTVLAGTNVTLTVVATGTGPLAYQWLSNGVSLASATNATLNFTNVPPGLAAGYSVAITNSAGSVTSAVAVLTIHAPPAITVQPVSQSIVAGSSVTFTVTAAGSPPPAYQWRFNTVPLADGGRVSGATSAALTVASVGAGDTGSYDVVVTNLVGSLISSNAGLTVNLTSVAPSITTQPTNQTVLAGTNVTLGVIAAGTSLSYQWLSNGVALVSATNATLVFANVQTNATATYSVVVTNTLGSVTSSNAVLTVNAPPAITSQPVGQSVVVGSNVTFSVTATGTGPLDFQWRFNTVPLVNGGRISGATSAALTLSPVGLGDAGNYDVVITNVAGSLTSSIAALGVGAAPSAPSITVQPTNQTVLTGTNVTLAVVVTGTSPLAYQWFSNGVSLATATNTTLNFLNAQTNFTAAYSVVITNSLGSVTSSVAMLTVQQPPLIVTQPLSQSVVLGSNVTFTVLAGGTAPLAYQWRFNGSPLANGGRISGATSAALTVTAVVAGDVGNYDVILTNPAGSLTSSNAALTLGAAPVAPGLLTQPTNQTVVVGTDVTLAVVATGTAPLSYQWRSNGVSLAGATNATLVFTNAQTNLTAAYSVVVTNLAGNVTSGNALLAVIAPPVLLAQPQSQSLLTGGNATFSILVGGSTPMSYQWRFKGLPLTDGGRVSGAATATLSLTGLTLADDGGYDVIVTNFAGGLNSALAVLTVSAVPLAPAITVQPTNQTVVQGSNATFTVVAGGTAPLAYQWQSNGVSLAGATNATLVLVNVPTNASAAYRVSITNSVGGVTSSNAVLTVIVPPVITTQPVGQAVVTGNNATFTVVAGGTAPLGYAWRFNGTPLADGGRISGAATASLTVAAVVPGDTGGYDVVVTNLAGAVTSSNASLTVVVAPVIVGHPQSLTNVLGTSATFGVSATGTPPFAYQWRRNGTNLPAATNATLVLANVQVADQGGYSVGVSNAAGMATSASATLAVLTPPMIATHPQSTNGLVGSQVTFSVGVSGATPLAYQWFKDGTTVLPGETSASLTIPAVSTNHAGNYSVLITNWLGSAVSAPALLAVRVPPFISQQPLSQAVQAGSSFSLTPVVGGDGPLAYQWLKNGTNLPGANLDRLALNGVGTNAAGSYVLIITNAYGAVTSAPAVITVFVPAPPVILTNLQHQTVVAGNPVTFQVAVSGSPPLSYQWIRNGSGIAGNDSPTLTLTNVSLADAGNYYVQVFNPAGLTNSAVATLTVHTLPSFTTQPQPVAVAPDNAAVFNVAVDGVPAPGLNWFKDGVRLTNATKTVVFFVTGLAQGGTYFAVATNAAGSTTSSVVALTVLFPPTLTLQPTNLVLLRTNLANVLPASFNALATGTAPLAYQWRWNGTALSGATNPTLLLPNVSRVDNGYYSVQISNLAGVATSTSALLRVRVPQRLAAPTRLPDGRMRLGFLDDLGGVPGSNDMAMVEVHFTTNFVGVGTVWSRLTNAMAATNGMLLVEEPPGLAGPRRFYRVIEK